MPDPQDPRPTETAAPHAEPEVAVASAYAEVRAYLERAKAPGTLRAYRGDWRHFTAWCGERGREVLPAAPDTLALYLTEFARDHHVSTLTRRLAAIAAAHSAAGYDSPASAPGVRTLMAGIRRVKGTAPATQKKPLLVADLERVVTALPENLLGARDAALLLMGFAGAFRRSELVGLNWEDVDAAPEGLVITIRRSKTDPEGRGRRIAIPYGRRLCPVRALAAWRDIAGAESGPVFRPLDRHGNIRDQRLSDKAVARVVKRSLEAAGVNASAYAGHSLRGGFATAAAAGGASERAIMRQTGHRSLPMLRRYIREGSLFTDNAVASTGL